MGPTCIHCKHCDVAELSGEEFLVCDLAGEDRLKVVAALQTCRDWQKSDLSDYIDLSSQQQAFARA